MTADRDFVLQRYGRLCEAGEWGDIGVKRALDHFEWLLEGDRWKQCGFDDINEFARSVTVGRYIDTASQRKRIVEKTRRGGRQPEGDCEQAVGVNASTVRNRDLSQRCTCNSTTVRGIQLRIWHHPADPTH